MAGSEARYLGKTHYAVDMWNYARYSIDVSNYLVSQGAAKFSLNYLQEMLSVGQTCCQSLEKLAQAVNELVSNHVQART